MGAMVISGDAATRMHEYAERVGALLEARRPACCQNGVVYRRGDDGYTLDFCDCHAGRAARYVLKERYLDWAFESYPGSKRVLNAVMTWLDGPRSRWLFIEGRNGTGKTGLAVPAYKWVTDRVIARMGAHNFLKSRPRPAQFWSTFELFIRHEATFKNPDLFDPLPAAMTCVFLVLDDLGAEDKTEYHTQALQQLIQYRYAAELRTVITTNLDSKERLEYLGERVMDRVRDASDMLSLTKQSLRGVGKIITD